MAQLDVKYKVNIDSLGICVVGVVRRLLLTEKGAFSKGEGDLCERAHFVGGSSIMYRDD